MLLRFGDGHPGEPLERAELALLRFLQLLVQSLRRLLAIGQALLATVELGRLAQELLLSRLDTLVRSSDQTAPLLHLRLDVGAQLHRLLTGLHARLAAHRLRLPGSVGQQLLTRPEGLVEARRTDRADRDGAHHAARNESDQHSEQDVHAQLLRLGAGIRSPESGGAEAATRGAAGMSLV